MANFLGVPPDQQQQFTTKAEELTSKLFQALANSDFGMAVTALESCLVFQAIENGLPLQGLMDNLLINVPQMYATACRVIEAGKVKS